MVTGNKDEVYFRDSKPYHIVFVDETAKSWTLYSGQGDKKTRDSI